MFGKFNIFLVGEHHERDKGKRKDLESFCRDKNIFFSTEHLRVESKYDSIFCDIGDLVCNLYSIIGSLYISISVSNSIYPHDKKSLEIIYDCLKNGAYNAAKEFYEDRYKTKEIFNFLIKLINFLVADPSKGNYLKILKMIKELIIKADFIENKGCAALTTDIFEGITNEDDGNAFVLVLECELRDQAMAESSKDVIALARRNGKKEFIAVVGAAHVSGLEVLLKKFPSVSVIKCNSYEELNEKWNHYLDFLTSEKEVEIKKVPKTDAVMPKEKEVHKADSGVPGKKEEIKAISGGSGMVSPSPSPSVPAGVVWSKLKGLLDRKESKKLSPSQFSTEVCKLIPNLTFDEKAIGDAGLGLKQVKTILTSQQAKCMGVSSLSPLLEGLNKAIKLEYKASKEKAKAGVPTGFAALASKAGGPAHAKVSSSSVTGGTTGVSGSPSLANIAAKKELRA